MTINLVEYVDWIQSSRACAACRNCAQGQLANENIGPAANPRTVDSIIPQVGFLGERYADGGILLLGKNPGGGYQPDPIIYRTQARITDVKTLAAATAQIRTQASSPKWKTIHNLQLPSTLGIEHTEIAYANQILCRSVAGNIRELEDSRPDILRDIYDTCFKTRIGPLLDILRPKHVVVIGRQKSENRSWPIRFTNALKKYRPEIVTSVIPVYYPFGSHIATAQADLVSLKNQLGAQSETESVTEAPGS